LGGYQLLRSENSTEERQFVRSRAWGERTFARFEIEYVGGKRNGFSPPSKSTKSK
jgi:hypothetical protein